MMADYARTIRVHIRRSNRRVGRPLPHPLQPPAQGGRTATSPLLSIAMHAACRQRASRPSTTDHDGSEFLNVAMAYISS